MLDLVTKLDVELDALSVLKNGLRCGFCCKTTRMVKHMVKSEETGAAICDQCVTRAAALMAG